jgi:hypothetical protein
MAFASLALTTEGKSDHEALHAMAVNCTRILAGADNGRALRRCVSIRVRKLLKINRRLLPRYSQDKNAADRKRN